jgi:hypothetical protein
MFTYSADSLLVIEQDNQAPDDEVTLLTVPSSTTYELLNVLVEFKGGGGGTTRGLEIIPDRFPSGDLYLNPKATCSVSDPVQVCLAPGVTVSPATMNQVKKCYFGNLGEGTFLEAAETLVAVLDAWEASDLVSWRILVGVITD